MHAAKRLPQFIDELDRDGREIVDEIERVLDLVGDAGGQLAERSEFLGLDQAVLRGAQFSSDSARSVVRCRNSVEQPMFSMAIDGLSGEFRQELDLLVGERSHLLPIDDVPNQLALLEHWDGTE